MAESLLCSKNLMILLGVLLVLGLFFYYNKSANKEGFVPTDQSYTDPAANVDNPLLGYATTGPETAYNFFDSGKTITDYDMFFNNSQNVLNQTAGKVASVPDSTLPNGMSNESCNAQCQRNYSLRRTRGLNRALAELNPMDLFGTVVAEPIFYNKITGKPMQSMYNNSADQRAGLFTRLNRIANFETANPFSQIGDVPNTAAPLPAGATSAFDANSGTLAISDPREVVM